MIDASCRAEDSERSMLHAKVNRGKRQGTATFTSLFKKGITASVRNVSLYSARYTGSLYPHFFLIVLFADSAQREMYVRIDRLSDFDRVGTSTAEGPLVDECYFSKNIAKSVSAVGSLAVPDHSIPLGLLLQYCDLFATQDLCYSPAHNCLWFTGTLLKLVGRHVHADVGPLLEKLPAQIAYVTWLSYIVSFLSPDAYKWRLIVTFNFPICFVSPPDLEARNEDVEISTKIQSLITWDPDFTAFSAMLFGVGWYAQIMYLAIAVIGFAQRRRKHSGQKIASLFHLFSSLYNDDDNFHWRSFSSWRSWLFQYFYMLGLVSGCWFDSAIHTISICCVDDEHNIPVILLCCLLISYLSYAYAGKLFFFLSPLLLLSRLTPYRLARELVIVVFSFTVCILLAHIRREVGLWWTVYYYLVVSGFNWKPELYARDSASASYRAGTLSASCIMFAVMLVLRKGPFLVWIIGRVFEIATIGNYICRRFDPNNSTQ